MQAIKLAYKLLFYPHTKKCVLFSVLVTVLTYNSQKRARIGVSFSEYIGWQKSSIKMYMIHLNAEFG